MMTRDERIISRIFFKNKIHEADGQKFEDIFSAIMNYKEIVEQNTVLMFTDADYSEKLLGTKADVGYE